MASKIVPLGYEPAPTRSGTGCQLIQHQDSQRSGGTISAVQSFRGAHDTSSRQADTSTRTYLLRNTREVMRFKPVLFLYRGSRRRSSPVRRHNDPRVVALAAFAYKTQARAWAPC